MTSPVVVTNYFALTCVLNILWIGFKDSFFVLFLVQPEEEEEVEMGLKRSLHWNRSSSSFKRK